MGINQVPAPSTVASVTGTAGRTTSSGGTTPVIDLATSGVAAATYGSASLIPALTVDTFGRVTSATTNAFTSGGWTQIASTNLSGLSTNTWSSISGYKFLRVVVTGAQNASTSISMRARFNGDETSNRYRNMWFVSSGTTGTFLNEADTLIKVIPSSFAALGTYGNNFVWDIYNPNLSGVVSSFLVGHNANEQRVMNLCYTNGPINSITLFTTANTWTGGTATLFGNN